MPDRKTVLIVDDNAINRMMLEKILKSEYDIVMAENGRAALEAMHSSTVKIAAVMLDIVMPVMDGYEVLEQVGKEVELQNIPIIVVTGSDDSESERHALRAGAWDFVSKPYDAEIIRFRIKNAIDRSSLAAFDKIKYMAEYDELTALPNKNKFYADTVDMFNRYPDKVFAIARMDINRFQLVNSYFGHDEGDRMLRYIAQKLREECGDRAPCTFGRIEADVFVACTPYTNQEGVVALLDDFQTRIRQYNINFDIVATFGVYVVEDNTTPVDMMVDYAALAAKSIKGNYMHNCAFYNDDMGKALEKEQEITNEMNIALEQHQFCAYIQPKYDLRTNQPSGGEALARWKHPTKGMVSPGDFIPVFEKNGFIMKLDYYIWEEVCRLLRKWIDGGADPLPISVNISRVNLYNPRLVDDICGLVEKYHVPVKLLELELTESAYMDNPQIMKDVVNRLHKKGFVILMDDFGSGYSSLNILKDVEMDVLKIDTKFLAKSEINGRSENVVASVVRMAKWLHMGIVAEGAEQKEQIDFLRGIGCECVQGFYFAKPMPSDEYFNLIRESKVFVEKQANSEFDPDTLWASSPQTEVMFSNAIQPTGIYEYDDNTDTVECLRVNNAFCDMFGYAHNEGKLGDVFEMIVGEYRDVVMKAVKEAVKKKDVSECEYLRHTASGNLMWVNLKIKYISSINEKNIIFTSMFDITSRKEIENELNRYRNIMSGIGPKARPVMLIVDDQEVNRAALCSMFEDDYDIIQAVDGKDALDRLDKKSVDIILLDMMMPVMNGEEFLKIKQERKDLANVPVVIITVDNAQQRQVEMLAMGASDYIVKPFVEEAAVRRVSNVMESSRKFKAMFENYDEISKNINMDVMTNVYNRMAAQRIIDDKLSENKNKLHAFVMIDIDNYKDINDKCGHSYGDMVMMEFAARLKQFFREGDIIARMGGDEFCVFMVDVKSTNNAYEKVCAMCREIEGTEIGERKISITCSAGVSISRSDSTFAALYKHADAALYESKRTGKNRATLYGMSDKEYNIIKLDREWLFENMDTAACIYDTKTREILYASPAAMRTFEKDEYAGKRCWELFGNDCCATNSCVDAGKDEYTLWVENCKNGRRLLIREKRINYYGKESRLQEIIDISKIDSSSNTKGDNSNE